MGQNNTINNKNIFGLFPEYNLEQISSAKKQQVQTTTQPVAPDTVEINGKKKKNKKGKIIFGSTLATTIIAAGITGLIFIKGGNKARSTKKLSELAEKLAKDIQEASANQTDDLMTKCTVVCKKGMKKTLDFLQATSNTNAIKDGAVDTMLRSNKVTRPFAEKSKNFIGKVVKKTLGKKYIKVRNTIDDFSVTLKHHKISDLRQLDDIQKKKQIPIKGSTKTIEEWTDDLARYTKELTDAFDDGFSRDAIECRDKKRTQLLSGLSDKVKARFFKDKGLFKAENYKTYATEELSKKAHDELQTGIINYRKKVTNDIQSIHDGIRTSLNIFSEGIKADDDAAIKILKELKPKLDMFKNCSGIDEAIKRAELSDDIAKFIDDALSSMAENSKYSQAEKINLIEQLSSIKTSVLSTKGSSKGALEEITTILKGLNEAVLDETGKKIITDAELKQFLKQSNKIRKNLIKTTELESGEFFLKQAELEVGSAANDIISILFPIGVGAYAIGKEEKKEEKVSAVLTTCIPLVGTFATFVYGTAKMFSGAKNLIFSGISGIGLGKLGNYCDKLYKEYRSSGSVVKVAKDEYDKFWTELTPKYAEPLKEIEETQKTEKKEDKK